MTHLDFCGGGEFCSLDDCLCECHLGVRSLAELRAKVEAHERIPLYGDGWLPQWSHVDWHCRCGWWGNHGDSGHARHFIDVVRRLLSEEPA